jgi:hypothetical protein
VLESCQSQAETCRHGTNTFVPDDAMICKAPLTSGYHYSLYVPNMEKNKACPTSWKGEAGLCASRACMTTPSIPSELAIAERTLNPVAATIPRLARIAPACRFAEMVAAVAPSDPPAAEYIPRAAMRRAQRSRPESSDFRRAGIWWATVRPESWEQQATRRNFEAVILKQVKLLGAGCGQEDSHPGYFEATPQFDKFIVDEFRTGGPDPHIHENGKLINTC